MITEVQTLTSYKLTLVMTEAEARWLKALFQNAVNDGEPREAGMVREAIFNALHGAGVPA